MTSVVAVSFVVVWLQPKVLIGCKSTFLLTNDLGLYAVP